MRPGSVQPLFILWGARTSRDAGHQEECAVENSPTLSSSLGLPQLLQLAQRVCKLRQLPDLHS